MWRDYGTAALIGRLASLVMAYLLLAPTVHAQLAPAIASPNPAQVDQRYATGRVESHLDPSQPRRQIIVRLPAATPTAHGELLVQPSVDVLTDRTELMAPTNAPYGFGRLISTPYPLVVDVHDPTGPPVEQLRVPSQSPTWQEAWSAPSPSSSTSSTLGSPPGLDGEASPIFGEILEPYPETWGEPMGFFSSLFCDCAPGDGIGKERLPHALSMLDTTQPFSNFAVRTHAVTGQQFPDRAEYFWARTSTGRGPLLPETLVNYQEVRLRMELGSGKFSTTTEVPFRWSDPLVNSNHAGLGDVTLATKTVVVDGKSWQITQFFKTYFNTGSPRMGLGTGHFSIEPGFLFRYKWSDSTYLHSEVKYNVPLGGHPQHSGQVLQYGFGISHLWFENDKLALIPTIEFAGWSVLNGLQTTPFGVMESAVESADGTHIFNLYPGLRIVHDVNSDLGLLEVGIRGGFPVTPQRWHDGSMLVELRWSF